MRVLLSTTTRVGVIVKVKGRRCVIGFCDKSDYRTIPICSRILELNEVENMLTGHSALHLNIISLLAFHGLQIPLCRSLNNSSVAVELRAMAGAVKTAVDGIPADRASQMRAHRCGAGNRGGE